MAKQRNSVSVIASLPDFGKVPPQSIDMEEAVLGAAIQEKDAVYSIMDFLKPESFYKEANQKIFQTILNLIKKGFPADLFTVNEELRANNELDSIGGPMYLVQLTQKIVSTANIEFHARIVAQKYFQRELIRIGAEVQTRAFDDAYDVSELLEFAETNLMDLSGITQKKKPVKLGLIVDDEIATIEKVVKGEISLMGVTSGFPSLNSATGGFMKQDLIIFACRPSTGKTALALQVAKNAAMENVPVGIFSLEMSRQQVARRYLSGETELTNTDLINGRCNVQDLWNKSAKLSTLPIYIDDTPSINITELKAKARRLIIENGVKMIIVDYLQLMKGEGQSREQEVSSCSRGLKMIAKEFNIPVIALSQLNRRLENTADKKPNLSDLRESGAIEQDADVVLFPYRPALYGQSTIRINDIETDTEGLMMLILAKNRNGVAHIELKLKHNLSVTKIWEEQENKPLIPLRNFNEVNMEEPFE